MEQKIVQLTGQQITRGDGGLKIIASGSIEVGGMVYEGIISMDENGKLILTITAVRASESKGVKASTPVSKETTDMNKVEFEDIGNGVYRNEALDTNFVVNDKGISLEADGMQLNWNKEAGEIR